MYILPLILCLTFTDSPLFPDTSYEHKHLNESEKEQRKEKLLRRERDLENKLWAIPETVIFEFDCQRAWVLNWKRQEDKSNLKTHYNFCCWAKKKSAQNQGQPMQLWNTFIFVHIWYMADTYYEYLITWKMAYNIFWNEKISSKTVFIGWSHFFKGRHGWKKKKTGLHTMLLTVTLSLSGNIMGHFLFLYFSVYVLVFLISSRFGYSNKEGEFMF